jgi:Protein of unknown function (DUF2975)
MHPSFERAKQLSRRMQLALVATAVIVVCVAAYAAFWALVDLDWLGAVFREKYGAFGPVTLSMGQAIALVLLFLIQIGLFLIALHALWQAFGSIAKNEGISLETARWIRRAGLAFAATSIAMFLSCPLNSLIGSVGAGPGRRFVNVSFDSQQLLTFLLAAVLIILGHILALAADIADDNRQIV